MQCACNCGKEFTPVRRNQRYLDRSHRSRAANRRFPVKRQKLSVASPDAHSGPLEALLHSNSEAKGSEVATNPQWPQFLTSREVVQLLRIGMRTLERWRQKRTGPPFIRCSHSMVRYSWDELVVYLRKCTQEARCQTVRELSQQI
jgi:hypothetical protein